MGNREVGRCSEVIGCVRLETSGTTSTRSYVTTVWFVSSYEARILERFVRNIRFVLLRDYREYKIESVTNQMVSRVFYKRNDTT